MAVRIDSLGIEPSWLSGGLGPKPILAAGCRGERCCSGSSNVHEPRGHTSP